MRLALTYFPIWGPVNGGKNVGSATTSRIGNYDADRQLRKMDRQLRRLGSATTPGRISNYTSADRQLHTWIGNYVARIGNYVRARISNYENYARIGPGMRPGAQDVAVYMTFEFYAGAGETLRCQGLGTLRCLGCAQVPRM